MDHLCYLCLMFFMLSRLFIADLWLTSWLFFVMFNCVFVTFSCGIPGQVCYLIVSIPYHYCLSYVHVVIQIRVADTYVSDSYKMHKKCGL